MTERAYWNEEIETLPRERLQALQEERVRRLLERVARRSVFYRRKLGDLGGLPLLSLEQFRQLPLTTKEEIRKDQESCIAEGQRPYANFLCSDPEDVRAVRTTSGTTGTAIVVPSTGPEMEQNSLILGEVAMRGFWSAGARPNDVLLHGWGLAGVTVGGATNLLPLASTTFQHFTVIPGHTGKSRLHLETMRDLGVTMLYATPSYIRYLAELARSLGIDPARDLGVRRVFIGGEAGPSSIPAIRDELEGAWGAQCYEQWGQVESRTRAAECTAQDGMHLAEDFHLFEVLDPETLKPLEPGVPGLLVVTYLLPGAAMPFLRYDTRDIVQIDQTLCRCGRTGARIKAVIGRVDDMVKVRGLRFYPAEVLRFVQALPGVAGMVRLVLDRDDLGRDSFTVQIEFNGDEAQRAGVGDQIRKDVRDAVGLEPRVELFAPGTLTRSMLKTPPVLDLRDAGQRDRYLAAMSEVRPF